MTWDIGDRIRYADEDLEITGVILEFRDFEVAVMDDNGKEWRLEPLDLWNGKIKKIT